jgi:hypothetical protein
MYSVPVRTTLANDVILKFIFTNRPNCWYAVGSPLCFMSAVKERLMKHDLENIKSALANYEVDMTPRPDGSIVLTIAHEQRRLVRVLDGSCPPQEFIRLIHFDMALDENAESINEAIKHCSTTQLPTYSREPLFRTRLSRLWAMRKLTQK